MKNVLLILNEQKLIVLFYKYIKLSNIMNKYPKCYKIIRKIAFKITQKTNVFTCRGDPLVAVKKHTTNRYTYTYYLY